MHTYTAHRACQKKDAVDFNDYCKKAQACLLAESRRRQAALDVVVGLAELETHRA